MQQRRDIGENQGTRVNNGVKANNGGLTQHGIQITIIYVNVQLEYHACIKRHGY